MSYVLRILGFLRSVDFSPPRWSLGGLRT